MSRNCKTIPYDADHGSTLNAAKMVSKSQPWHNPVY